MKIITQFLLKKYFINFLIVLCSLEFFFVGIDFLQNFKSLPPSANLQLLYLLYNGFFTLTLTLPLSLSFAWVLTLVSVIRNNELVALLSLGAKSKTIFTPAILSALALLLCLIGLQSTPMAYSYEQKSKILKNQYFVNSKSDIFVKYNEFFVYIKKLYPLEKRAEDIQIFKIKDKDIVEHTSGPKAYFQNNKWYVINAKIVKKPKTITWSESKLDISYEKFLHILEGFKPKILDNVYDSKAGYSIQDGIYALLLLSEQNVNTDKIRSSLYYQILVPFFILPMMLLVYKNSAINSRFFNMGSFITFGVFGTLVVWGIFFMLHKFASGGIILPELAIALPLIVWCIAVPLLVKRIFGNNL